MTSASRRHSSSATRRRSSSDTSRDSSQLSTRARRGSQSSRDRSDSTDTGISDLSTRARQGSLSSRDSTDSIASTRAIRGSLSSRDSTDRRESVDISETVDIIVGNTRPKEPVGKTKRDYLKGNSSLSKAWKSATSSNLTTKRASNLKEIDSLLESYEKLGWTKLDSPEHKNKLNTLGKIEQKLELLEIDPKHQVAASDLKAFIQAEIKRLSSADTNISEDYLKDNVNLLETWQKKTSSTVNKNRGKNQPTLLKVDRLLGVYQKLGKPKLGNQDHIDNLREIDQTLDLLLKTPSSRQTAAEELQAFIKAEIKKLENENSPDILKVDIDKFVDFRPENAAEVMTGGVQDTLDGQNDANAIVWYNTLFSQGKKPQDPEYDADQERVLKQQQELLKRYFFSLASLGVLGGDQSKDDYQPLETFLNKTGERVGLASVASGGGLFNFRSSDGSGESFRNFLYGVADSEKFNERRKDLDTVSTTSGDPNKLFEQYLGAYKRPATHGSAITDKGKITETGALSSDPIWTGINIPIGGVGQHLTTTGKTEVTTGYQGRSTDKTKTYQTGAVLFNHYQSGNFSNTLMGFEGSAPHTDNIHGGSHGALATVGKTLKITASGKTLTGQGKRDNWDVANGKLKVDGKGGRIAKVDANKLVQLKEQWGEFQNLSDADQQVFFKKLLLTTTQQQRDALLKGYGLTPQKRDSSPQKDDAGLSKSLALDSQDDIPPPPPDEDEDIPPPPPILNQDGSIRDDARVLFRDAYRQDIRDGAYLAEAEGHIAANEMGIQVQVYNDKMPVGFVRIPNPANGDCLLYSLLQAQSFDENQTVLNKRDDFESLKSTIQRQRYREKIAAQITDEAIDQLTDVALAAEIENNPEVGLGSEMQSLLGHSEVVAYRQKVNTQPEEEPSSLQPKPSSDKEKGKKGAASSKPVELDPIATYGTGSLLSENVALFHQGNHYTMIYKP